MTTKQKIILWVCLSFATVCFAIYSMLGKIDDGKPKPLQYPLSGLSGDLFDSQNTTYTPNASLAASYSFKEIPFIVDLMDGRSADVDSGHLVYGSEDITFFVSEYPKSNNPHDVVLSQFPKAVYINYAKDASYVQTVSSDSGYINGYFANYFIDHLLISTGPSISTQSAYVIGYIIDPGADYDFNIILALATTAESTESFNLCKGCLDEITYTLRYDSVLDNNQIRERERALKEAEKNGVSTEPSESTVNNTAASNTINAPEGYIPVIVERDFKNMSILVTWENACESPAITFETTGGIVIASPDTVASKQALIEVGACQQGTYYLNCSHYKESGDMKIKLIEN